jgi:hypothetical protein
VETLEKRLALFLDLSGCAFLDGRAFSFGLFFHSLVSVKNQFRNVMEKSKHFVIKDKN